MSDSVMCWCALFDRVDGLMKASRRALINGDKEAGLRMLFKAQRLQDELVEVLSIPSFVPSVKTVDDPS